MDDTDFSDDSEYDDMPIPSVGHGVYNLSFLILTSHLL